MIRINRLFKSFGYAIHGLVKTFREEQNIQIQSFLAAMAVLLGVIFQIARTDWLFLIFAITLVILMEIVNSAVERVSDILKPRINTYVKEIKDIMAAAVMLASISAVIIGLIIFLPHLNRFFLAIGLNF